MSKNIKIGGEVINGVSAIRVESADEEGVLIQFPDEGGTKVSVNGQEVATWDADTKLDKQTGTSSYGQVYGKTTSGGQTMWNVNGNPVSDSIPLRFAYGHIKLPNETTYPPTDDDYAVSKRYGDGAYTGKRYNHQITISFTESGTAHYSIGIAFTNNVSTAYTSLSGYTIWNLIKNIPHTAVCLSNGNNHIMCGVQVSPSENYTDGNIGLGFFLTLFSGSIVKIDGIDPNYNSDISNVSFVDVVTAF